MVEAAGVELSTPLRIRKLHILRMVEVPEVANAVAIVRVSYTAAIAMKAV